MNSTPRSILEWDIRHTDRIELVDHAVSVAAIMTRHIRGGDDDPWCPDRALSSTEQAAYDAALAFLANEFMRGAKPAESHLSRSIDLPDDEEDYGDDDDEDYEGGDFTSDVISI